MNILYKYLLSQSDIPTEEEFLKFVNNLPKVSIDDVSLDEIIKNYVDIQEDWKGAIICELFDISYDSLFDIDIIDYENKELYIVLGEYSPEYSFDEFIAVKDSLEKYASNHGWKICSETDLKEEFKEQIEEIE